MHDLRFAIRQLLKYPGFTAVAVLTLALGIGANSVVFSVARAVLLRPLDYRNEERLMWFDMTHTHNGTTDNRLSRRDMEDIRTGTRSFEEIATFGSLGMIWEDGDSVDEASTMRVTPNLDEALGIRPSLGRLFMPSDVAAGEESVVVISHELWQSRFGGSPDVLGRAVLLDKKARTIVGVLPPGLKFPLERSPIAGTGDILKAGQQTFWVPMAVPRGPDFTTRSARMFLTVALRKPGVTEAAARADLAALSQVLAKEYPESNRHWAFDVVSFRDQILGQSRQGIPLLAAAVAAVLLICCVNLANLLLTRGVTRQRELAVRLALGAGRGRLVWAHMLESGCLALLGGVAGIALANAALHLIRDLGAASVPFIRDDELNDDGYGRLVILNETAAALLFPGRSAVGGRFTVGSNPDRILEVIGVVKDTRDVRLEEKPQPRFYWQYAFGGAQVVVRGRASVEALTPMLRNAVLQADSRIRGSDVQSMTEIVASTVAERRFLMVLVTGYAVMALGIAAIGVFGVVAYQVAQRRNEFGLRLALGAQPSGLMRLVLFRAGRVTLVGLILGLGVSFATNRLLASQLFGLSPHDPMLLAGVCVVLLLMALLASVIPARRAARIDPVEALRHE